MNGSSQRTRDDVWAAIAREKRWDRVLRGISVAAWAATFLAVVYFGLATIERMDRAQQLVAVGVANQQEVVGIIFPFVGLLGGIALLIAVLSTIGIFLRMRTTTLTEVQLRLAALEEMLARRGDSED